MLQFDLSKTPEKNTEQIITGAVAMVDSHDSPRSREEHEKFAESKDASWIFKTEDRALTFFGSIHTTNADASTVKDLRADLRDTLSIVSPERISFMVEGRYGDFDRAVVLREMEGVETIEIAVQRFGEKGVAMWLVAEYAKRGVEIEISSPERPEMEIAADLRKEFASEDIAMYLMLRQWTSELGGRRSGEYSVVDFAKQCMSFAETSDVKWIQEKETEDEIRGFIHDKPALEAYAAHIAQQFLDRLNTRTGLSVSLENLRKRRVDDATLRVISDAADPLRNKVSARWNEGRDRFLVRSIGEAMLRGKKPYVIFGASHVIGCRPALEKLAELAK